MLAKLIEIDVMAKKRRAVFFVSVYLNQEKTHTATCIDLNATCSFFAPDCLAVLGKGGIFAD